MGRNRRNQSAAVRFGPALKAFLLCVLVGGSGLGYVWQKNQIYELGSQIKKGELRLGELRTQNKQFESQLKYLQSEIALETRMKKLQLGLVMPLPSQVVPLQHLVPIVSDEQQLSATELRRELRTVVR